MHRQQQQGMIEDVRIIVYRIRLAGTCA